jgi:ComEC/Rec2-related protein
MGPFLSGTSLLFFCSGVSVLAYVGWLSPRLFLSATFFLFLACAFFIACRKKALLCLSVLLFSLASFCFTATETSGCSSSLPLPSVRRVEGVLVDDGALMRHGGQHFRLRLSRVTDWNGTTTTAKGVVSAGIVSDDLLPEGTDIVLWGLFDGGQWFSAKDHQVRKLPRRGELRMRIQRMAALLLERHIPDRSARSLSLLLLLGRGDREAKELKDLAMESGCSHLLALSGMHLGFLMQVLRRMLPGGCSLFLCFLYVFLVGPKPSLVRAFIAMLVRPLFQGRKNAPLETYVLTLSLHLLLFPSHASTLGFLLSYLATAAIVFLSLYCPHLHPLLWPFAVSLLSVLLTMPVTLLSLGSGNAAGLLLSSPATFLVLSSLYLSFLSLLPGRLFPFLLEHCSFLLFRLLGSCTLPMTLSSYLILLLSVLTLFLLLGYAGIALRRKRRRAYELELRLRFTFGDQTGA